jgi:hypothetical protein
VSARRRTQRVRVGRAVRLTPAGVVPAGLLLAGLLMTAAGCSEKAPPNILVWDLSGGLVNRKSSLTAAVAAPGGPVLVVGYERPERRVANTPLCVARTPSGWTPVPIPMPSGATPNTSVILRHAVLAEDGTVWACGRVADTELEPSLILPLLYRYQGGSWAEVPITGAGDLSGVDLHAVATHGSGPGLVLRVAGTSAYGTAGAVLTLAGGAWSRDSLPPLPEPVGQPWSLNAIGRAPDGTWYAGGGWIGAPGGILFVDDDARGWKQAPGLPGYDDLEFTAIGFDPEGYAWLAGNYAVGDELQGVLLRGLGNRFAPAEIARLSAGSYRLYAIGFDGMGHGWVAGGRAGNQPFLAGYAVGRWTEKLSQLEAGEEAGSEIFVTGITIHGLCVLGAESAIAAGYAEVLDPEGIGENEALIYELMPRPPGEIDLVYRSGELLRFRPTAP